MGANISSHFRAPSRCHATQTASPRKRKPLFARFRMFTLRLKSRRAINRARTVSGCLGHKCSDIVLPTHSRGGCVDLALALSVWKIILSSRREFYCWHRDQWLECSSSRKDNFFWAFFSWKLSLGRWGPVVLVRVNSLEKNDKTWSILFYQT